MSPETVCASLALGLLPAASVVVRHKQLLALTICQFYHPHHCRRSSPSATWGTTMAPRSSSWPSALPPTLCLGPSATQVCVLCLCLRLAFAGGVKCIQLQAICNTLVAHTLSQPVLFLSSIAGRTRVPAISTLCITPMPAMPSISRQSHMSWTVCTQVSPRPACLPPLTGAS